jgi:hypothetical protein
VTGSWLLVNVPEAREVHRRSESASITPGWVGHWVDKMKKMPVTSMNNENQHEQAAEHRSRLDD